MPWPILSDYSEAVQNPQICFTDPDLRAGTATSTPLGLPRSISGAFASVYQFSCPSGRWAVRCFLREFADHQARYQAISQHLAAQLPWMVGFEFQPKGIRVNGRLFPIVKMEWIDGEPLNTYVARNLGQPQTLSQLGRQWIEMLAALKGAQIAHGDLQHGNILVSQSRLRLIDYDGMFVPALQGRGSHEEGHRNFQHPKRTARDFDATLDHFSAWVIFISISALVVEPGLWPALNAGDECLLFRRTDFERPDRSPAFQAFDRSSKPELRALGIRLRAMLTEPLARIPSLDGTMSLAALAPSPAPSPAYARASALPMWLESHVTDESMVDRTAPKKAAVATVDPHAASATWIIDHLVDKSPMPAVLLDDCPLAFERVTIFLLAAIWTACAAVAVYLATPFAIGTAGAVALSTLAVVYACVLVRFRSMPACRSRSTARRGLAMARRPLQEIAARLSAVASERERELKPLTALRAQYHAEPRSLQTQLAALYGKLEQSLATLNERRSAITHEEMETMRALEARTESEIDRLNKLRFSIDQVEQKELDRLGATARSQHVQNALTSARVRSASIHGIGPKLKATLQAYGINCAADVNYRSINGIPGIGPAKANTLLAWRMQIVQQATFSAPIPNGPDADVIRSRYRYQRQNILDSIAKAKAREDAERQARVRSFSDLRATIDQEEADAKRKHDEAAHIARQECERRRQALEQQFRNRERSIKKKVKKLNESEAALQRSLFGQQIKVAQLERELGRFRLITFRAFLAQVVWLRTREGRKTP